MKTILLKKRKTAHHIRN